MKKLITWVFCVCLCTFLFAENANIVYAAEKIKERKIIKTEINEEVQEKNSKLENIKTITAKDLIDLKDSKIKIDKLDSMHAVITITNKIPERIDYLDDGTQIEHYSQSVMYGKIRENSNNSDMLSKSPVMVACHDSGCTELFAKSIEDELEYPDNLDVELYGKMKYTNWVDDEGYTHSQLNYCYGKLIACHEDGYRNLKIVKGVSGSYLDPDGTSGYLSHKMPKTVSNPVLGKLYTHDMLISVHYFDTGAGAATIGCDVSVEYRHGNTWYDSPVLRLRIPEP